MTVCRCKPWLAEDGFCLRELADMTGIGTGLGDAPLGTGLDDCCLQQQRMASQCIHLCTASNAAKHERSEVSAAAEGCDG